MSRAEYTSHMVYYSLDDVW